MFECSVENARGESLTLTGREDEYQVYKISGLSSPKAQINSSTIANMDGAVYNSAKLNTRNIVLMIKINGDAEANRLRLYRYFVTKEKCRFYYKHDSLDVFIDGFVDTFECNLFSKSEFAQISIVCLNPYFQSLQEILADASQVFAQFEFPFSINLNEPVVISDLMSGEAVRVNNPNGEQGAEIDIIFNQNASKIVLDNTLTGDVMTLNYSFLTDDALVIRTYKGEKSITLIRNNTRTNLLSALAAGSRFIQLGLGYNSIVYTVDNSTVIGALTVIVRFNPLHRGV